MDKIGKHISCLQTPAFVINERKVEENCKAMLQRAAQSGVELRGQTKTHKTVEGGILQTGGTKRKIVTSTLVECEMYADAGFDDILYGFPLIQSHFERVYRLTEQLQMFHLMVTNKEMCKFLSEKKPPTDKKWSIFIKIDCGNARAGVFWDEEDTVVDLVKFITSSDNLVFEGLYAHCGNSYSADNLDQVNNVRSTSMDFIINLVNKLKQEGLECPTWGIGSTPSCSSDSDKFKLMKEMHPGNYVFYDNQQVQLGSCTQDNVAGKVITRVIGHYPRRNQMLVDCGFTGLTKQGKGSQNPSHMIALVETCQDLILTNMTQEIGFIESKNPHCKIDFSQFPVGSILTLVPYHACASAACYEEYFLHNDVGIITQIWKPCKGW